MLPKKPHDKEKSILDPFVLVNIVGLKMDKQCQKTPVIQNNGNNFMSYIAATIFQMVL